MWHLGAQTIGLLTEYLFGRGDIEQSLFNLPQQFLLLQEGILHDLLRILGRVERRMRFDP
jgi:hypothetical protein